VASRKIVVDHNLVPTPPQCASCMTSDITRTSNDKNDQPCPPLSGR
jgi:hypothetical protein